MKNSLIFSALILAASVMFACSDPGDPSYLTLSPEGPIELPAEGNTVTVTVNTNVAWVAASSQAWCVVTGGSGSSAGSFTVSATANTSTDAMPAATVTVTAGEGYDQIVKTINVTQKGAEPEPEPEPLSLSEGGTANCYILTAAGRYSFDATVIGNGADGIVDENFHASTATIAPVSARLVWQDRWADGEGFISSVELKEGRVVFEATNKFPAANALIAACDAAGNIIWSWHIWRPDEKIEPLDIETGYKIMNMNLGADFNTPATPGSFGMLYQWGRKDPLPAADVLAGTTTTVGKPIYNIDGGAVAVKNSSWTSGDQNTLAFAIANPTMCLSRYSQGTSGDWLKAGTGVNALWGNPQGAIRDEESNYPKGNKSIYDPCPVGWRVPPADVFHKFTSSGGYVWANTDDTVPNFNVRDTNNDGVLSLDDYNYGWHFMLSATTDSYFPAAARFDGQYAMLMGSMTGLWGSYWSNAANGDDRGFVPLAFGVKNMSGAKEINATASANAPRADAYSIRCIVE
ncbi:MAG: BACON domain-containing protein [Alistipes sp.]|jgi:hypothetical protein|nr:BACON domain-containing protein [Alistipes sp.]